MTAQDGWDDPPEWVKPDDWIPDYRIPYDPKDPGRTMSIEEAAGVLQAYWTANKSTFANKYAEVVKNRMLAARRDGEQQSRLCPRPGAQASTERGAAVLSSRLD